MDDQEQLDVIAVGAHPDDVEVGCGGTLAALVQKGYRVGVVDLTDGEPTPLCDNVETRLAEAADASAIWVSTSELPSTFPTAVCSILSKLALHWPESSDVIDPA